MFLMSDPQTSVINPVKRLLAGSKEHTATVPKFVLKDLHITCLHHMLYNFHEFGKPHKIFIVLLQTFLTGTWF